MYIKNKDPRGVTIYLYFCAFGLYGKTTIGYRLKRQVWKGWGIESFRDRKRNCLLGRKIRKNKYICIVLTNFLML